MSRLPNPRGLQTSKISSQVFIGILFGVVFAAVPADACPNKWDTNSCPTDMSPTGMGTCIDMFEWPNMLGAKPSIGLSALPEHLDKKHGLILDADSLCKSIGKRVCTREEWVSACKGPRGTKQPWGNSRPKKKPHPCNTDKQWLHPDEAKIAARDETEMSRLDQSEQSGARESCKSWEHGAYDLIGNVEEWVTCTDGSIDGWCLMGRYWSELRSCEATVRVHAARWHYYETAARCCL